MVTKLWFSIQSRFLCWGISHVRHGMTSVLGSVRFVSWNAEASSFHSFYRRPLGNGSWRLT